MAKEHQSALSALQSRRICTGDHRTLSATQSGRQQERQSIHEHVSVPLPLVRRNPRKVAGQDTATGAQRDRRFGGGPLMGTSETLLTTKPQSHREGSGLGFLVIYVNSVGHDFFATDERAVRRRSHSPTLPRGPAFALPTTTELSERNGCRRPWVPAVPYRLR